MPLIIKSELNSVVETVELSSDDKITASTINNGIPNIELNRRPSTPDSHCSICLDHITNKCYSNSCRHTFCFECLKRWSVSEPTCPLCKTAFTSIHHSFGIMGIHEIYIVPASFPSSRIFIRQYNELANELDRMFRMFLNDVPRTERMTFDGNTSVLNIADMDRFHNLMDNYSQPAFTRPMNGQDSRIQVYTNDAWALPLSDITGRFRDCSIDFYRNNPEQTFRLNGFILRDIVALRKATRRDNQSMPVPIVSDVFVTNLIVRLLAVIDIRSLHEVAVLQPFLYGLAGHFCHELLMYAMCPYDLDGFDRRVQYPPHDSELNSSSLGGPSLPPSHILGESIIPDSDNEDVQSPNIMEVIEVSSSADAVEAVNSALTNI